MGEFIDQELEHGGIVSGQIRDFTRRYGFLTPVPDTVVDGLPTKWTFTHSGKVEDVPEDPVIWEAHETGSYMPVGRLSDITAERSLSAADIQSAHYRVSSRLGDVVSEGWDSVISETN